MCSQSLPNPKNPDLKKPIIYFDSFLISGSFGYRQCYLHVIKILREYADLLATGLMRLLESRQKDIPYSKTDSSIYRKIPSNIGTIAPNMGDAGCGFEDVILGGRVLIGGYSYHKPWKNRLEIATAPFPNYPLDYKGNTILRKIKDEYIIAFIDKLYTDLTTVSFKIPLEQLNGIYIDMAGDEQTLIELNSKRKKRTRVMPFRLTAKKTARRTAEESGDERDENDDYKETKSENTDPQINTKENERGNVMVGMRDQEDDDEDIYGRYAVSAGMSDELWEFLEENGRKA
jgi:hypothetical protein